MIDNGKLTLLITDKGYSIRSQVGVAHYRLDGSVDTITANYGDFKQFPARLNVIDARSNDIDTGGAQVKLDEIKKATEQSISSIKADVEREIRRQLTPEEILKQMCRGGMNSSIERGSESAIANAEKFKADVDKLNARISEEISRHDDKLTNRIREVIKAELRPGGLLYK